jgi:hypothetical protein
MPTLPTFSDLVGTIYLFLSLQYARDQRTSVLISNGALLGGLGEVQLFSLLLVFVFTLYVLNPYINFKILENLLEVAEGEKGGCFFL